MYKQKKNEKSTKNKWKRSRSRMYGIGILIVTLCLTACEKRGVSDGRGPIGRGRKK